MKMLEFPRVERDEISEGKYFEVFSIQLFLFPLFQVFFPWFFVRPSERVFEAIGWHNVVVHAIAGNGFHEC